MSDFAVIVGKCPVCGETTLLRLWKDGTSRICQICGDMRASEFNALVSSVISMNDWKV